MKSHVFLAGVISMILAASDADAIVGLQPQTSVSPGGGVSITLAVPLPPGTAGLTPQVAFTYNANGSTGVMAKGWGLSGISSVTRCPTSYAVDRLDRGVQYDAVDGYCLDGRRLIQVSSGQLANGYNYVEFRSEIETFQRIVGRFPSPNYSGGGPTNPGITGHPFGFRVWSTSGTITDFGRFESAGDFDVKGAVGYSPIDGPSVTPQYAVPIVWSIRRHMDTFGNRIDYTYAQTNSSWYQNGGAGTLRIAKIEYGANSKVALSHHSWIDFEYASRSDNPIFSDSIAVGFFKYGGRSLNAEYLTKVNVWTVTRLHAGETSATSRIVAVYRPVYSLLAMDNTPYVSQAVVRAIQRCNPTIDQICNEIQPALFTYDSGKFTFGGVAAIPPGLVGPTLPLDPLTFDIGVSMNANPAFWVDLNGDGLTDICVPKVAFNLKGLSCRLATRQATNGASSPASLDTEYTVQFNAPAAGPAFIFQSVTLPLSPSGGGAFDRKLYMADINGDGKTDLCVHDYRIPEFPSWIPAAPGTQELKCYLSQSTADTVSFGTGVSMLPDSIYIAAPVNSYDTVPYLATPQVFLQDLNKDGLADICYTKFVPGALSGEFTAETAPNGSLYCYLRNPRSGLMQWVAVPVGTTRISSQSFVDVNRDGLVDLCYAMGDQTWCNNLQDSGADSGAYSYGTAQNKTFGPHTWPISRIWQPSESFQVGGNWVDLNGDGYLDVCLVTDSYKLACAAGDGNGWGTSTSSNMDSRAYLYGTGTYDNVGVGLEDARQWTDFDGDGRMDFCRVRTAPDGQLVLGCHLNKPDPSNPVGVRFTPEVIVTTFNPSTSQQPYQGYQGTGTWIDANGDGQPDYCRQRSDNTTVDCFLVRHTFGELRAVESIGNRTTLKYGYLATSASYTPIVGPASSQMPGNLTGVVPTVLPSSFKPQTGPDEAPQMTYPWVSLTPPIRVVTSITRSLVGGDNAVGLSNTMRFEVTGRIANLLDSRSGGFVSIKTMSEINGGYMSTIQKNSLIYPFTGSPLRTESFGPDGSLVKRTESWYEAETSQCGPAGFGATNPPFTGAKSWPYVVKSPRSEEKVWDSGNRFMSGNQTRISPIDACGKATQVVATSFGDAASLSAYKKTTDSLYQPAVLSTGISDSDKWNIGKVTRTSVTHVKPATSAAATLTVPTPGVSVNPPAPPLPPAGSLGWLPAVLSVVLN